MVDPASVAIFAANGVGGAIAVAFAAVAKNRQDAPASTAYKRLLFAVGLWSFAYAGVLVSPTVALARAFDALVALFSSLAAFLWLFFAIEYTGRGDWLTPGRGGLLLLEPVGYALVYATNPIHGWAYSEPAGGYAVPMGDLTLISTVDTHLVTAQIAVIYLVTLAAFALLVEFMFRTRNIYRKQTLAIVVGPLVLFVGNVLFVAGLSLHQAYDPTPVSFVLTSVFVGVALFRYDFLNVAPLAADMLIDEMNDPVLVVDETGDVIDHNDAAAALFEGHDAVGRSVESVLPGLFDVLDGEDPAGVESDGGAAGADGRGTDDGGEDGTASTVGDAEGSGDGPADDGSDRLPTADGCYRVTLADGDRVFDPDATPIHDHHGIRRGRLVVLRDVTLQKRRETELQRKNERLEQFVGVVSHDLRNPLNVAQGHLDLARERDEPAHIDRVDEALSRTEEMIDELLELARQGRTVGERESIHVGEAAATAWDHVDTADATLETDADLVVEADPARLQEAFENLFRNSVEHGGADVIVTVRSTDDGFVVEDDGAGFERIDRVFESGYTTARDGTGFGLEIVETVVEAHGWRIEAAEGPDGGARFEVTTTASVPDPVDDLDPGDTGGGDLEATRSSTDDGREDRWT